MSGFPTSELNSMLFCKNNRNNIMGMYHNLGQDLRTMARIKNRLMSRVFKSLTFQLENHRNNDGNRQ